MWWGGRGPYSGQNYYWLDGPGYTGNGATNGGASRINWTGSSFTVDSGFENHPVTYVSWYGATAFASYYGWRLPTEWEWQAVADYDGSYTYGCGMSINNSIANYLNSTHPHGTTAVGAFGTYGYGMADMAGNVWEWTSTLDGSNRVVRGGSWANNDYFSAVAYHHTASPPNVYYHFGFRVCRSMAVVCPSADVTGDCRVDLADFAEITSQWLDEGGTNSCFVRHGRGCPIDDPGVSGHEDFTGEMSTYETTNAQYCAYLNEALASGDITVSGNYVVGTSGPYSGQNYYYLAGSGYTDDGATNGGAARINWTGSSFTGGQRF